MKIMILQCPRCRKTKIWERETQPSGPGSCKCRAWADWKVLNKMPDKTPGFVVVYSHLGKQELHGPDFCEDPDKWEPEIESGLGPKSKEKSLAKSAKLKNVDTSDKSVVRIKKKTRK